VTPSFRVVATLNTWDRSSLFRLSAALLRRFAVVHVAPPDEGGRERLIAREASVPGGDPPLDPAVCALMGRLFSGAGVLAHAPVGPAILLDMIRYARRRGAGAEGLAEAVSLLLLPQLEGLPAGAALGVAERIDAELAGLIPPRARADLRGRLRDVCPDFEAGRALPLPPRRPSWGTPPSPRG
jgi:MoxR-like ATPase